ncbi:hypothetical protein GYMLUDRAFT_64041 [Collybiopsis luxurians FD-317 M1]|uniref:Uncharacterized protein n=1 Tax=Collybiopsis luxurians FD-317 M1 TaxID=944289 RepID=A0A0D0CCV7_9AGAR|nr:hypothetical protein GYMLUDRAFT_64041 [Collybiopsis luxurians FD-317 M1]
MPFPSFLDFIGSFSLAKCVQEGSEHLAMLIMQQNRWYLTELPFSIIPLINLAFPSNWLPSHNECPFCSFSMAECTWYQQGCYSQVSSKLYNLETEQLAGWTDLDHEEGLCRASELVSLLTEKLAEEERFSPADFCYSNDSNNFFTYQDLLLKSLNPAIGNTDWLVHPHWILDISQVAIQQISLNICEEYKRRLFNRTLPNFKQLIASFSLNEWMWNQLKLMGGVSSMGALLQSSFHYCNKSFHSRDTICNCVNQLSLL